MIADHYRIFAGMLVLLVGLSCQNPRKNPKAHLPSKKGPGFFWKRNKSSPSSRSINSSPLKKGRVYILARIIEEENRFSDLLQKNWVIKIKKNISGKIYKKILTLSERKISQSFPIFSEGETLWMALVNRGGEWRIDREETTRLTKNPQILAYLKKAPPPSLSADPADFPKMFRLFRRGNPRGTLYFRARMALCYDFFLKKLRQLQDISLLQRGFLLLSTFPHKQTIHFLDSFRNHQSTTLRISAVAALGNMAHPLALETLAGFAKDSSREVRSLVAYDLRFGPSPLSAKTLFLFLGDSLRQVVARAIQSLGILKIPKADEKIIHLFSTLPRTLQRESLKALGRLATPRAIQRLVKAVRALGPSLALTALLALVQTGDEGVDGLISLIEHPDPYLGWRALYELRRTQKNSFGYPIPLSVQDKKTAVKKWREWWQKRKKRTEQTQKNRN